MMSDHQLYQTWFAQQLKKWTHSHQRMSQLTRHAYDTNRAQLRHVLQTLKDTAVARQYHVEELLVDSHDDDHRLVQLFMDKIPISTYPTIASDVQRMIVDGESNLLVPSDAVALYSEMTGTTGVSKQFPVNRASLQAYHLQMDD